MFSALSLHISLSQRACMQNRIKHSFSSAEDLCLCEEGMHICGMKQILCCVMSNPTHAVCAAVDVVSVVTPPYLHCKHFLGESAIRITSIYLHLTCCLIKQTSSHPGCISHSSYWSKDHRGFIKQPAEQPTALLELLLHASRANKYASSSSTYHHA